MREVARSALPAPCNVGLNVQGCKVCSTGIFLIIKACTDCALQIRCMRYAACCSAPEVLLGGRASTASDIWSFGVILHELITGRMHMAWAATESLP